MGAQCKSLSPLNAYTYLDEAVTLATAFNYQEMIGLWQPVLGLVTLYRGDPAAARQLLTASLRLAIELKDEHFQARICAYLAETELFEGLLDEAVQWLRQSLTLSTPYVGGDTKNAISDPDHDSSQRFAPR